MAKQSANDFDATCLPLLPDCYAFALSLTRNPHDANDLVQDAYLKAFRKFASFTPGTNAKAWLFTIVRHAHIDRFRRSRRRPLPLPEDELTEMAGAVAPPPNDAQDAWAHIPPERLLHAIDAVPDPFGAVVRLRDLHGLSYREISEVVGIPAGTVMSRLHRGREYVRQALVGPSEEASTRPPNANLPEAP